MKFILCLLCSIALYFGSYQPLFSLQTFVKNVRAQEQYQGKFGSYSLWIDPEQWRLAKDFSKENKEDLVFCLRTGCIYGNFRAEPIAKSIEDLKQSFLKDLQKYLANIKILNEEIKFVNGVEVLCLNLIGITPGPSANVDVYLYSGESFSVSLSVTCPEEFHSKNEQLIYDFLNGFSII